MREASEATSRCSRWRSCEDAATRWTPQPRAAAASCLRRRSEARAAGCAAVLSRSSRCSATAWSTPTAPPSRRWRRRRRRAARTSWRTARRRALRCEGTDAMGDALQTVSAQAAARGPHGDGGESAIRRAVRRTCSWRTSRSPENAPRPCSLGRCWGLFRMGDQEAVDIPRPVRGPPPRTRRPSRLAALPRRGDAYRPRASTCALPLRLYAAGRCSSGSTRRRCTSRYHCTTRPPTRARVRTKQPVVNARNDQYGARNRHAARRRRRVGNAPLRPPGGQQRSHHHARDARGARRRRARELRPDAPGRVCVSAAGACAAAAAACVRARMRRMRVRARRRGAGAAGRLRGFRRT